MYIDNNIMDMCERTKKQLFKSFLINAVMKNILNMCLIHVYIFHSNQRELMNSSIQ